MSDTRDDWIALNVAMKALHVELGIPEAQLVVNVGSEPNNTTSDTRTEANIKMFANITNILTALINRGGR